MLQIWSREIGFLPRTSHVFFLDMVSRIMHLQPGGDSGVLLQSNCPQILECADSFVLILEFNRRLMLMFSCRMNVYQSIIGKVVSEPLPPDIRWLLCVWMAHLTRFCPWLNSGTSCTVSPWYFNVLKCYSLTSLSSRMLVVLYHFWFTWSSSFKLASCSVSVFLFGIGSASIAFGS